MNIFTEAIMYRSCSAILSVRQSTDEQSFPRKSMKSSKRSVWRYRTGTTSCSSKSEPTKTMCISSSSPYPITAPRRSYGPSRALPFEKSCPECPRSKSTSGVENSGPMAIASSTVGRNRSEEEIQRYIAAQGRQKEYVSLHIQHSNYSEEVRLHQIPRSLLRGDRS